MRERLDTVPTPVAEDLATALDALGVAEARRLREPLGRRACSPRSSSRARARRAHRAVPARARCRARTRDAAAARALASSSTTTARSRATRWPRASCVESATAVDRLDALRAAARRASSCVDGTNPVALQLCGRRAARARAHAPARRAGAATCSARLYVRARDPLGFLVWEATAPTRPRAAHLPARGRAAPRPAAARDAGLRRQRGLPAEGRGHRVRRHAPVRGPGDPLKRVNWRASARRNELWVNESHPERNTDVILFVDSFAEARLGGRGHARPRGACDRGARRRLRPPARPRRADRVRRDPALARPGHRARAALPHRRRAARHADRPLLLLEGDRRDPAARCCRRTRS